VPQELVKSFLDMQANCIKFRMSEDDDYEDAKQQFEHLRKL